MEMTVARRCADRRIRPKLQCRRSPLSRHRIGMSSDLKLPTSMTGLLPAIAPPADRKRSSTSRSRRDFQRHQFGPPFFGVKAAGNSFCYLVDSSPAWRKEGFHSSQSRIGAVANDVKPKQRFYIIFFGGDPERLHLEPTQRGTLSRQRDSRESQESL